LFILKSPSYKDVSPNGLFPKKRIIRRPLENSRDWICRTVSRKTKTGQQPFSLLPDNSVIAARRAFIFRRAKFLGKANGASGPPP
jgi:hypothetical protein